MIHDIFSKKAKEEKIKSSKIIIDVHEKNSLVPSFLNESKLDIEFQNLTTGDYLIRDVIIERKTISDFISSMISKRLIQQILELQTYTRKFLILEGEINDLEFNPNAIRGMILSIQLDFKIPIIFTKDSKETSKFLEVLARKQEKTSEFSLHSKKGQTKKEIIKYIVEGFPGIGPKNAEKLLKELKTIRTIINAPLEIIEKIIGKKAEEFNIVDEEYD
jgi:Fanconi anemia group M protein